MDEAEKLTALKKAYADIILNTAKEAASRIMVTERKAMRFQQELFAAKEEALHMLLRLKQMMDSKITEAEMTSISQQQKIEELEAQLHEAEDIVSDLRAELMEMQDKLEKVTVNQSPLEEQNLKGYTATLEEEFQENRLHTSDSNICPPMDSQPEHVITFDVKDSTLNQRNEGDKCQSANGSGSQNQYVGNPDFASIMMMNKDPELSRNGCTQRIRALERESDLASRYSSYTTEMSSRLGCVDEKMSFSGEVDGVKNEAIVREDEKGSHTEPVLDVDICYSLEKEPDELKEVKLADKVKVKKLKRLDLMSRHLDNQVMEMGKTSNISSFKTSSRLANNDVQSGENPPQINDTEAPKDRESRLASNYSSYTTEMDTKSVCEVNESKVEFVKPCSTRQITNNDNTLLDKVDLYRQQNGSAETSVNLVGKIDLGVVNAPLQSDLKTFDVTTNGVSGQPANDRLIKYTFQRKRKKESLSSTGGSASLEENILKRKKEEEHHGSLDSQTSSSINESSRYNRRLAQVARQLISLSEKKWWQ